MTIMDLEDLKDLDNAIQYHCSHTPEQERHDPMREESYCGACEDIVDHLVSAVGGIVERHMNRLAAGIEEALKGGG